MDIMQRVRSSLASRRARTAPRLKLLSVLAGLALATVVALVIPGWRRLRRGDTAYERLAKNQLTLLIIRYERSKLVGSP